MAAPFIEFRGITKTFGGVVALSEVSLSIGKGECHALMGENGAGTSTLGKTLAGIHRADSGTILIEGQEVRIHSPADASRLGIGMVHQELAFCPDLSVAENLVLGHYPRAAGFLFSARGGDTAGGDAALAYRHAAGCDSDDADAFDGGRADGSDRGRDRHGGGGARV